MLSHFVAALVVLGVVALLFIEMRLPEYDEGGNAVTP